MNLYRKHLWIIGPRVVALQQALLLAAPWFSTMRRVGYPSSDLAGNPHVLRNDPDCRSEANRERRRIGVPADQEHVVFSFSDPQYYRQHLSPDMERYHAPRNSDLGALLQPLRDLRARGLSVVRVGIVGSDLATTPIEGLVRDAQLGRSEKGEMALIARARFGWTDMSGAWWAWTALGLPTLLTSQVSLHLRFAFPKNLIYVPNLYRRSDGSDLTFGQMLAGTNKLSRRLTFQGQRVERVMPSARHITAAFDEVLTLPRSRTAERVESDEVRELRERLAKVFLRANQPPNVGMASQFLIDHAHLIDD
jgi:putative glycosyltransferase (TIGR04372 family)